MPWPKTDFESLFPEPSRILKVLQNHAPAYYRCPKGHALPHRVPWGRCSAMVCMDDKIPGTRGFKGEAIQLKISRKSKQNQPFEHEFDTVPVGHETEVLDRHVSSPEEAEAVRAQSEEAVKILQMMGRVAARDAIHPVPDIPPAPDLAKLGPKAYVKQRLEDISPWLLEQKIQQIRFGTDNQRDSALADLLDRSGTAPKNPEPEGRRSGPVFMLSVTVNPFEKQKEIVNAKVTRETERGTGQVTLTIEGGDRGNGASSDGSSGSPGGSAGAGGGSRGGEEGNPSDPAEEVDQAGGDEA